jgi:hypothetical protein
MTTRPKPVQRVTDSIDRHVDPEPRGGTVEGGTGSVAEHLERQQAEAEHTYVGTAMTTEGQVKGALFGVVVGGAIGAVLAWPFGFIGWGDADVALGIRILTCAVIGFLAGSVAGAVYWGGRMPELTGETLTADGRPQSSTTPADPHTDERGRSTSASDDG